MSNHTALSFHLCEEKDRYPGTFGTNESSHLTLWFLLLWVCSKGEDCHGVSYSDGLPLRMPSPKWNEPLLMKCVDVSSYMYTLVHTCTNWHTPAHMCTHWCKHAHTCTHRHTHAHSSTHVHTLAHSQCLKVLKDCQRWKLGIWNCSYF